MSFFFLQLKIISVNSLDVHKCFYPIEWDLLSVKDGVDFHIASLTDDTEYMFRVLVHTRSWQIVPYRGKVLLIRADLEKGGEID